jgi:uncharacterized membrane protein
MKDREMTVLYIIIGIFVIFSFKAICNPNGQFDFSTREERINTLGGIFLMSLIWPLFIFIILIKGCGR